MSSIAYFTAVYATCGSFYVTFGSYLGGLAASDSAAPPASRAIAKAWQEQPTRTIHMEELPGACNQATV